MALNMIAILNVYLISVVFIFLRLIYLIRSVHQHSHKFLQQAKSPSSPPNQRLTSCNLTVLLGSGGHTAEMIRLLSGLPFDRYTPRTYLISSGDSLSKSQIIRLEKFKKAGDYMFYEIPRARRVNQSFLTSVFTTAHSLLWCIWLISIKPFYQSLCESKQSVRISKNQENHHQFDSDLILLNGPGSAVPIALSAFFTKFITGQTKSPRLVYVESLARVKRLSFTGIILLPFMDCFVVQWKTLYDIIDHSRLYHLFYALKLVPPILFDGWMV